MTVLNLLFVFFIEVVIIIRAAWMHFFGLFFSYFLWFSGLGKKSTYNKFELKLIFKTQCSTKFVKIFKKNCNSHSHMQTEKVVNFN